MYNNALLESISIALLIILFLKHILSFILNKCLVGLATVLLHEQSRTKLFLPYLNTLPGKNYASSKIGVLSLGPIGHALVLK